MKAALLRSYGGVDQFAIEDVPAPKPGEGEVLLRLEASAVNPFDLILRQGLMAQFIPLQFPAILGGDGAGTIVELGAGVTGWAVGDRVAADFVANGRGAHAEYGVVPATSIARLPDNLSFEQGAALVKAGLTGRQTVDALNVKPGDRVLVSGALGSVGRAAIQYLQQLGAQPVAGVRPDRLDEARELAGDAIDISSAPPSTSVFDLAISAAGPVAAHLIGNVRDGGRIASIVPVPDGANAGNRVTIHELYHQTDAKTLDAVIDAAKGRLVIPIAQIFTLDQIGAAQNAVAAGAKGKIVLKH